MRNANGRTTTYQTRRRSIKLPLHSVARDHILALVGHLIADHNRLPEMGLNELTPDMIPDTGGEDPLLDAARVALTLMYDLAESGLPPTAENLLPGMKMACGEHAQALLADLLGARSVHDDPNTVVASYAFYVSKWINRQAMQGAVEAMLHIVDHSDGDTDDIYAQLSATLGQVAPARRQVEVASVADDFKAWRREFSERKKRAVERGSVGPETPFPTLNRMTGPLRKGELDLWSAKTGGGKSTIAWLLASHAAWGGRGGYNVLFFAFEQNPQSILERYVAARLDLTTRDFQEFGHRLTDSSDRAYFDPDNPDCSDMLDNLEREIEKNVKEKGEIWIARAAGWGSHEIESEVARRAATSSNQNRELYVIYDYYDLINPKGLHFYGSSQTSALEAITDFMRDTIGQQYEVYTTAFAQDSVNTDYIIRQMPYNGQRIYQRSQRYVRIERTVADGLLYALEDDGRTPKRDPLGRPILLHDVGQANSNSLLHIIKCNDGETGYVPVRFWNGRFKVEEQVLAQDQLKERVNVINRGNRNYERQ